jgi:uncharacterized membrane protein YoaK (UPF0700 family)
VENLDIKTFEKRRHMDESFLVAVFLTLAGGFQDSYSYVARGKVFCNAQTGNIVLLAGNLFSGNLHAIGKYLIPLLAFVLGVYIAVRIEFHFQRSKILAWQQAVLLIEMLSMLIAGFLPANAAAQAMNLRAILLAPLLLLIPFLLLFLEKREES